MDSYHAISNTPEHFLQFISFKLTQNWENINHAMQILSSFKTKSLIAFCRGVAFSSMQCLSVFRNDNAKQWHIMRMRN